MNTFGRRLRAARMRGEFSQRQLADACGVDKTAISHLEHGRSAPSCVVLVRIANALDVSTDYLLGRTSEPSR